MRGMISWLLDQYAELAAAVRFLSILPLPDPPQRIETGSETTSPARVVLGSGYFSLVGLLLGLLLSFLVLLLYPLLPLFAIAALLVVALVLFTGGLLLYG